METLAIPLLVMVGAMLALQAAANAPRTPSEAPRGACSASPATGRRRATSNEMAALPGPERMVELLEELRP